MRLFLQVQVKDQAFIECLSAVHCDFVNIPYGLAVCETLLLNQITECYHSTSINVSNKLIVLEMQSKFDK